MILHEFDDNLYRFDEASGRTWILERFGPVTGWRPVSELPAEDTHEPPMAPDAQQEGEQE